MTFFVFMVASFLWATVAGFPDAGPDETTGELVDTAVQPILAVPAAWLLSIGAALLFFAITWLVQAYEGHRALSETVSTTARRCFRLIDWLTAEPWPPFYDQMVLMFQREVAERIVARPGGKSYGRLAVLAGWRSEAKILFDVAPSAFVPAPKVTSSVVRLTPRPVPLPCDSTLLQRVTEAAFGQRRKMLRQSLKSLGVDPMPMLETAGIVPTARAEEIPVAGFVGLARAFTAKE